MEIDTKQQRIWKICFMVHNPIPNYLYFNFENQVKMVRHEIYLIVITLVISPMNTPDSVANTDVLKISLKQMTFIEGPISKLFGNTVKDFSQVCGRLSPRATVIEYQQQSIQRNFLLKSVSHTLSQSRKSCPLCCSAKYLSVEPLQCAGGGPALQIAMVGVFVTLSIDPYKGRHRTSYSPVCLLFILLTGLLLRLFA